jgi:acetyltransferase-like isoleucine patch superfamily enzyme
MTTVGILNLLLRTGSGLASRWRNWKFRALGVSIKGYCWMRAVEIPRNWSDIRLGQDCALDRGTVLLCSGPPKPDKLVIGDGTYVNRGVIFDAHDSIVVGRDVMVGPNCFITDGNHGMGLGVSVKSQPMVTSRVRIEDEVWIGAGVIILPGVLIGRGAVVAAGSVVTKSVEPFAVVAGSPARILKMR